MYIMREIPAVLVFALHENAAYILDFFLSSIIVCTRSLIDLSTSTSDRTPIPLEFSCLAAVRSGKHLVYSELHNKTYVKSSTWTAVRIDFEKGVWMYAIHILCFSSILSSFISITNLFFSRIIWIASFGFK